MIALDVRAFVTRPAWRGDVRYDGRVRTKSWLAGCLAAIGTVAVGCGGEVYDGPTASSSSSSSGSGGQGGAEEAPSVADLTADSNRDGAIGPGDQDGEDTWSSEHGAIFLPNLDDDDRDGVPDALNDSVDGPADALDLAPLEVAAWPDAPDSAVGSITIDAEAAAHVRIFVVADSTHEVAGGAGAADEIALTTHQLRRGVALGIEGLHLRGTVPAGSWDGTVELTLEVYDAAGTISIDVVQLRVASWILRDGFMGGLDRIAAINHSSGFLVGLDAAAAGSGLTCWHIRSWNSASVGDEFQIGFVSMPVVGGTHGAGIALARPWANIGLPIEFLEASYLGPDLGFAVTYEMPESGGSYDSFSNHLLIPPHPGYPHGRIVIGTTSLPETLAFYDAQEVQGPILTVVTSWLQVGHVDEVINFVPAATERGWKMLVGSPALARTLMQQWQALGFGAVQMFVGKLGTRSIDEVLADTPLMSANTSAQGAIDGIVADLTAELGLASDDIVDLPVLYHNDFGGFVAYTPNPVPARIWGDDMLIPMPFGPIINGSDAMADAILDRLATGAHKLGSGGGGMTVWMADTYDAYYHPFIGPRGATFMDGPVPAITWWDGLDHAPAP